MPTTASPSRRSSDRARIYIFAVVVVLILAVAVTIGAMVIVNHMKNSLIEEAKAAIRENAEDFATLFADIMKNLGIESIGNIDDETRSLITEMAKEQAQNPALTLFTLIEDGQMVYMVQSDGTESGSLVPDKPAIEIPPVGMEEEVIVPVPLASGGDSNIQILYHLSPLRVEASLKPIASAITRISWLLVSLLLILITVGIIFLARTLSHLLAIHDEANRLDRLAYVGTLAAGLAHEIRNPLNAMNMNVDLIDDDLGTQSTTDPTTRRLLGGVKSEITHLNKTVENFLAYARPTKRATESIDLGRATREAIITMEPEFKSRDIDCQVGDLPTDAMVEIDPTSIHQTLTNILLNAAQSMDKPERRITITGEKTPQTASITIADTGAGIPPDRLDKIFEVFFTTKTGGSGLGLPTAKRVVEDAGGAITIDSLAGHGTQLTITLPLTKRRKRR